jgi:hypothetical protein
MELFKEEVAWFTSWWCGFRDLSFDVGWSLCAWGA